MKKTWLVLGVVVLLAACDDKASSSRTSAASTVSATPGVGPWMEREPEARDREEYFDFLVRVMPQTLDAVTCACCGKSLRACYADMDDTDAETKCPYT